MEVLDCTLRDGGYVNNWMFGERGISYILSHLTSSKIDIIECGYLNNLHPRVSGQSIYESPQQISPYIPEQRHACKYVAMINYGEFDLDKLPPYDGNSIDGIRVIFHKKDVVSAIEYCAQLKEKGYLLFIQPMVTITYSDEELIEIINKVNEIKPFAFYFVDSFGVMKKNDMLRLFYLIDHNLAPDIRLGYHAHNNIQMAYANAQTILDIHTTRQLIIDSSVFGMGRGAGNLNTELFVDFLNSNFEKHYEIYPLLEIIDEELNRIYQEHYWGYSLPHYLSSLNHCHPNYATYFAAKDTLTIQSMNAILEQIPEEHKSTFSKNYAETLYQNYQTHQVSDEKTVQKLSDKLQGRTVLILAPGRSVDKCGHLISEFIQKENPVIIAVNFVSFQYHPDYIFCSNEKRLTQIVQHIQKTQQKVLLTSNLEKTGLITAERFNYNALVNHDPIVGDNACLMLIKLLERAGCSEVFAAGMDGYSDNISNYVEEYMDYGKNSRILHERNEAMKRQIQKIRERLQISFITPSVYIKENS